MLARAVSPAGDVHGHSVGLRSGQAGPGETETKGLHVPCSILKLPLDGLADPLYNDAWANYDKDD